MAEYGGWVTLGDSSPKPPGKNEKPFEAHGLEGLFLPNRSF